MRTSVIFGFALLLFTASGCRDIDVTDPVGSTPELPSEAPRVDERVTDSPGKPLPPIGIRYEVLGKPEVGQPLDIRVTAHANVPVLSLTTRVSGDEGLFVAPASSSFAVPQMDVDEPAIRTVTVTPLREGMHRLSIVVQGEIGGLIQASNVTIPIPVGNVETEQKPMGTLTTDESGEAIISLPARQN